MRTRLYAELFSIELRKLLYYRFDFWINFLGGIFVEVFCGYFVWKSVFEARGVDAIKGYGLSHLVLYYLLTALVIHSVSGKGILAVSQEIYDGGLNRYLVYPVWFAGYKFIESVSVSFVGVLQLIVALTLYHLFFASEGWLTINSALQGMLSFLLAVPLYFSILLCLEFCAFWVDNVWSLSVLVLKIAARTLGGAAFPLVFFPDAARQILEHLPFYAIFGVVVDAFMGKITFDRWLASLGVQLLWLLFFSFLALVIWKRGRLKYTGVGI